MNMGVEPKIGGKPPKMDGVYNGKPHEQMEDLGVHLFLMGFSIINHPFGVPLFLETPISMVDPPFSTISTTNG